MTKLRILLFVACIVVVAVLIVFPYRSKTPVTIAFLGNLSGNASREDIMACKGGILAVERINAGGGINGRRLKLAIFDYKGQDDRIAGACRRRGEKKVGFLLAPYVNDRQLTPCAGETEILTLQARLEEGDPPVRSPLSLGLIPLVQASGKLLGSLSLQRGEIRLSVLQNEEFHPFSQAFLDGFLKNQGAGEKRTVTRLVFSSRNPLDLNALAARAMASRPDGVLILASPEDTGRLGGLVRRIHPSVALYAGPWAAAGKIEGDSELDGMSSYVCDSGPGRHQGLDDFFSAYQSRNGGPPDMSALFGYESVLVLAQGIRNSAEPDPYLVGHTLEKLHRFKGLASDYVLNRIREEDRILVRVEVRGGRLIQPE